MGNKIPQIKLILMLMLAPCLCFLYVTHAEGQASNSANLAKQATATASSIWNNDYAAQRAIDDNPSTRWNSQAGKIAGEWLQLEWPTEKIFNQIVINQYVEYTTINSYKIQYWKNNTWMDAYTGNIMAATETINFNPVTSSKVRLIVYSTTGNTPSIFEFKVYNADGTSPTPTPVPTPSGAGPLKDGHVYKITVRQTGRVLDVWDSWKIEGSMVVQMPWANLDSQKWMAKEMKPEVYQFKNVNSGLVLMVANRDNGAFYHIWRYVEGAQNELFKLRSVGDGYYAVIAQHTGACMMMSANYDKATIHQWTCDFNSRGHHWKFEPLSSNSPLPSPTPSPTPYATPTPTPKFTIPLSKGWNLISLPLQPIALDIPTALSSINGKFTNLYAYDGTQYLGFIPGSSSNQLTKMEIGRGYWILMKEAADLVIEGTSPSKNEVNLKLGWNLVGLSSLVEVPVSEALSSINGKYVSLYEYDNATNSYKGLPELKVLKPGKGYWLEATAEAVWKLGK